MNCTHCRQLLSRYHDGMLDITARDTVRAHLRHCPDCIARLAQYQRIDRQIGDALAVTVRPGFRRVVFAATSATAQPSTRRGRRQGQLFFGSLAGGSVASMAILTLIVASSLTVHHVPRQQLAAESISTRIAPAPSPRVYTPRVFAPLAVTPATRTSPDHPRGEVGVTPLPTSALAVATSSPVTPLVDRAASITAHPAWPLSDGPIKFPLWSPDARSLLYLTGWTVNAGWFSGTLTHWTPRGTMTIGALVRNFDWSPDGQSIAYATEDVTVSRGMPELQQLHVVRADGANDRVLGTIDRATNLQFTVQGIVCVRNRGVVVIDPVSGATAPLTRIPSLQVGDEDNAFDALSGDLRFLALQDSHGLRVWDRRQAGTLVLQAPLARKDAASFHFSWDEKTIFYSTYDGRYTKLYRQPLDPWAPAIALNDNLPLAGPITQVGAPLPTGAVLSFVTGSGAGSRSYVIDTRHGKAHLLLPPGGVGPISYWSPDGARMVYTLYRGDAAVQSAAATIRR